MTRPSSTRVADFEAGAPALGGTGSCPSQGETRKSAGVRPEIWLKHWVCGAPHTYHRREVLQRCGAVAVRMLGAGVDARVTVAVPQVPRRAGLDESADPDAVDEFREGATITASAAHKAGAGGNAGNASNAWTGEQGENVTESGDDFVTPTEVLDDLEHLDRWRALIAKDVHESDGDSA